MFESLQAASADAILGLIAEHKHDSRAEKIDLGVANDMSKCSFGYIARERGALGYPVSRNVDRKPWLVSPVWPMRSSKRRIASVHSGRPSRWPGKT